MNVTHMNQKWELLDFVLSVVNSLNLFFLNLEETLTSIIHICGQFGIKKQKWNITDFVKKATVPILEWNWVMKTNDGLHTKSDAIVLKN
jgi:hypothetical protein